MPIPYNSVKGTKHTYTFPTGPADTSLDSFEECERACGITPADRTRPTVSLYEVQRHAQAAQAAANKQYNELLGHAALAEEYERYKQRKFQNTL